MNTSKLRCDTLPIPADAKLSFCGTVRECATSSLTVLAGTLLATTSAEGATAMPDDRVVLGERIEGRFRFLVERLADRDRVLGEQQRVAVGVGGGDVVPGEIAARAGPVLDHHRLAERVLKIDVELPRQRVGRAARHEGDDQTDRPVGIAACADAVDACQAGHSAIRHKRANMQPTRFLLAPPIEHCRIYIFFVSQSPMKSTPNCR